MLRHKCLFLIVLFTVNLCAIDVIITKSKINYKEIISINKLSKHKVLSVKKHCIPATVNDFETNKFVATHYMKKGSIICQKDIELYNKNSVLFNFGTIEIEKNGKVIFENEKYIRIKKDDGKIEKIYKDGRLR